MIDGEEVFLGTDQENPDTDGDGICDSHDENPTDWDEVIVDPGYADNSINNRLPFFGVDLETSPDNSLLEGGETDNGTDTDKNSADAENQEDGDLDYTGARARIGLLAALGSVLEVKV